jgi:hypothetical protein
MTGNTPPRRQFRVNPHGTPTCRLDGGPLRLNRRMERMIDLMIEGDPMEEPQEPLDLYSAAKAAGYLRKAARELAMSPVFAEAYNAKLKAASRKETLPVLCPSLELVREQMRHRQEMNAVLAELKEARQKLDDKRREMVEHYKHCPKNPKAPNFSDGAGYEIRLDPQDAKTDA